MGKKHEEHREDTINCMSRIRDEIEGCVACMDLMGFGETFDILTGLHDRIGKAIEALRRNENPADAFSLKDEDMF